MHANRTIPLQDCYGVVKYVAFRTANAIGRGAHACQESWSWALMVETMCGNFLTLELWRGFGVGIDFFGCVKGVSIADRRLPSFGSVKTMSFQPLINRRTPKRTVLVALLPAQTS